MQVVLAESYGMCFGVRDAVALALNSPFRTELTVLGQLVHNPEVLRRLDAAGVRTAAGIHAGAATPHVMITAHGASRRAVAELRDRGHIVHQATCPLVTHAHRMLDRLVAQGFFPVIIGKPDHVEVQGLIGDLDECAVIESEADLHLLAGKARLGIVSQTTQPPDLVCELVAAVRASYPDAEVRHLDTACQPTKERQEAARRLGFQCEVVIVVGGRNSNNTRHLVKTCEAGGARAYQVESADDLRSEWLAGVKMVGLTAGTSTPDEVIDAVHKALLQAADPGVRAQLATSA